jgi:hypothetical protein
VVSLVVSIIAVTKDVSAVPVVTVVTTVLIVTVMIDTTLTPGLGLTVVTISPSKM